MSYLSIITLPNGKKRRGHATDMVAFLEAEMMIVKNITEIAWVPGGKGRKGPPTGAAPLKGHYQVRVKTDGDRKDGGFTTTTASIEWVEKHF